jgi:RNA-directed DNA polymerase
MNLTQAFKRNCRNQSFQCKGEAQVVAATRRAYRCGALGRNDPYERWRFYNGAGAKGSCQVLHLMCNLQKDEAMDATRAKPFNIDKKLVYDAYKAVKANAGATGVDGQSLEMFDKDLMRNLYKIWNRMSSGSYFPPPVRAVPIPKKNGGQRLLGVPTVTDRVAQMVVKKIVEREVEPIFLPDSYGYRPNKSAIDAIGVTRKRCWQYDFVLEFDIRGLFDNIDHTLLLRAVRKHVKCKWSLLYIERWLTAPMEMEDGTRIERSKGTPQGGVVSPVLANLFLHYAFDAWMTREYQTSHGAGMPMMGWCTAEQRLKP